MALGFDRTWMWHPDFTEDRTDSAGCFVHFRRTVSVKDKIPPSLLIHITADTRYKLYINGKRAAFGPVKGDASLWFYDTVDITPFLTKGENHVAVHVLRLFYSTTYSPSFSRLPLGGLRISLPDADSWKTQLESSTSWETAVDHNTILRVDDPEDYFLHLYQKTGPPSGTALSWKAATLHEFKNTTGNAPPWHLSPRQIPHARLTMLRCSALHNIKSDISKEEWEAKLIGGAGPIILETGTRHELDIEFAAHTTAFIRLRCERPSGAGAVLTVTYSESYENPSSDTPWSREKGDRCDSSRSLIGPKDIYHFQGKALTDVLEYEEPAHMESFCPFHFRTFRFLKLEIETGPSDLVIQGLEVEEVVYPLDVQASLQTSQDDPSASLVKRLLDVSSHTLNNCMHDCYEDCPFYEQLQYAMDTRSSALFTYNLSGDDRMARQAIVQLHNAFQSRMGLTTSRAPTHRPQFIPYFSLYWICMVCDHFDYFGDRLFSARFMPIIDGTLSYFGSRLSADGLVTLEARAGIWNFVDWTPEWKPYGVPPSIEKTGVSTYGNHLYAYALDRTSRLLSDLGRQGMADEYLSRADEVKAATRAHCQKDGLFCDTVVSGSSPSDYSVHSQIWAVLSGTVSGDEARELLRQTLRLERSGELIKPSVSMSFYTMRALSLAGGGIYEEHFHQFWEPWKQQLHQNVTTWVEDNVSQRSDCHAWGSVPIYEYFVEVIGLRPRKPQWAEIVFSPRIGLYRNISARVPLCLQELGLQGVAHVSWETRSSGDVEVRFNLELSVAQDITVHVSLPGHDVTVNIHDEASTFLVRANSFIKHYV